MVLEPKKRFPSEYRLRKRWQYLLVQNQGIKVVSRFFIGLVIPTPDAKLRCKHARLGITTTGRYGNAVARNRTRRLVREAFRQGIMEIPNGVDVVVIPKKHAKFENSASIFQDLSILGNRVRGVAEKTRC
ncbi:MAG: ribonuclease P protein component [Deltaproteobacteria bacterium]|nr:ribonuclease P protein component [Deltaproteobacteria bacterium]